MQTDILKTRRSFLKITGTALMIPVFSNAASAAAKEEPEGNRISPVEDLMREHGVINRVLLIYDELLRRMKNGADIPVEVISGSAGIVRRFIENYHEKLEEEEIFPRMERAGKLTGLIRILRDQHRAGRLLTDTIMLSTRPEDLTSGEQRNDFMDSLRGTIRMYRPHAAREDTVLFPAFREIVTDGEYYELGERFEHRENELFGEDGFAKIVEEVSGLEKKLGIYDLRLFTPKEL